MNRFICSSSWLMVALASTPVHAQEDAKEPGDGFVIKPVLLDAQDGEGTVGLDFETKGQKVLMRFDSEGTSAKDDLGGAAYAALGDVSVSYEIAGTAAANAERNPKNFLDALFDIHVLRSVPGWGSASGGAFVKYETDQKFEAHQTVHGLRVTYVKARLLRELDYIAIDVNRGQADPKGDEAREAALGTGELRNYYRNELDVRYHMPVSWKVPLLGKRVEAFEFSYRYFVESGAPSAVKAANLDTFNLRTYRLCLPNGLYVAYSSGKLPFDRKEDTFFELGLSYELK